MALPLDDAITIIAIETADVLTFGETLTPGVAAAMPRGRRPHFPLPGA